MKKKNQQLDRAFDRVVFGTNDPKQIEMKLETMKHYLELEASSLGHSLAGIRHRNYWSYEKAAEKAGVSLETWRSWESDRKTPSVEELTTVLKRFHWSWELERFLALRQKAPRVKLGRLLNLCPNVLAAKGVGGLSASYEWQSLEEGLKRLLKIWADARGLCLPDDLISVLSELRSDEEREAWMSEVLGSESPA